MSVTVSGDNLDQFLEGLESRFNSPEVAMLLAQDLSEKLVESFSSSGLDSRSGATVRALSYVAEPERTGNGWILGVGDRDALGEEDQSAPRGTLRSFFSDHPEIRPSPWAYIPQSYKDVLESMRRAGMYGGRGPDYANYMWVQNAGNAEAGISGKHFIESALSSWESGSDDIVNDWWSSLSTLGKAKRYVKGAFGR